jgi:copper(I)-binding protein
MRDMKRSFLLACALAACAAAAHAQVTVTDAWVRGTVPGQTTTGAFMQLRSAADAKLVAVTSPVAKMVEIHETKEEGGVMKMRAREAIDLPAGKAVALAPGGFHVMLMGVGAPLKVGATVPLALVVEAKDGSRATVDVAARVRPPGAP